ncbi:MAG: fibronectin type III domain-containing protein [Spirochaetes bacterium]|nr:fibronectin type III domain-containing protein [Spirochaetota bacterium]
MKAQRKKYVFVFIFICAVYSICRCSSKEEPKMFDDTTPPVPGTPITFTGVRSTSITISWGEASDDVTLKEKLQYRVVTSPTYININTTVECANLSGNAVVREWSEYVPSITLTGLVPQTTYWFSVLVRDEKGNMAIYYPQQVRTFGDDAPTPGSAITFNDAARTENSIYAMWGAAKDVNYSSDVLEYRMVKSDSASKIDTVSEALAVSGSDLVMDWTQNVLEKQVTGLSMGTRYFFAVLVRNPKLKVALYSPKMTTTRDTKAPTVGGNIYFTNVEADTITVNWPAATDNLTLQGDLYYKVVRANTVEEIDTIEEANQSSNVVLNWTRNKLSVTASGLSEYTKYYFGVLVKDEQNNMALYAPQFQYTKDIRSPVVTPIEIINDFPYYIKYHNVTDNSLNIAIVQADDPDPGTPPGELLYRVVWAHDPSEIDQADEISWHSNVVKTTNTNVRSTNGINYDWVKGSSLFWDYQNQHTIPIENLDDATTYYFAIAVRDWYGNAGMYSPRAVKTKDITPPTPGVLTISPNDVHSTWVKLAFTEAQDNSYSNAELQYRVVIASSSNDIDTVEEVLAITNSFPAQPGIVHDWAKFDPYYDGGIKVNELTNNNTYYFAVAVKDPENNAALYGPVQVKTHVSWEPVGVENFATTANTDSFALRIVKDIPHVVYLDGAASRFEHVTVQRYEAGEWSALGEAGFSGEAAVSVDLESDGSGNVYVGYIAYNNDSPIAKVAAHTSGIWNHIGGIPNPFGKIQQLDLAMKGSSPAIFVIDKYVDEGTTKWAPRLFEFSSSWNEITGIGNVGVGNDAYVFGALGYDADMIPYLSFNDVYSGNRITVKAYKNSMWVYPGELGFSNYPIMFSQIAFDTLKTPHVAYLELYPEGMIVRVKKCDAGSWVNVGYSPIDTGGYANALSLAMVGNIPYVAFSDSTKEHKARVMKLRSTALGWEYVEYINSGISPTSVNNISIALDSSGMPYIAFRQNNKLTVMVYK